MFADFEFKYLTNIFYFLLAIAAVLFFVLAIRKKEKILALLRSGYIVRLKLLRSALLFIGLCLLAFSLLGPQVFAGYTEVSKIGLDIYVLIDTSKSMLVSDIKPDRITVAKKVAGNLLSHLVGDRIGFIPFASGAYIQMPLTDDYQLARMFLDVMDTDMISGGGTNLAAALRLASESFKRSSSADRVIIIISDGEEHDGVSYNILKNINDERIKIFTVGIGTEKGGLVPVYNAAGDVVTDYMKDEKGNPVTSRLESQNLQKLARDGNGAYYQATLQGSETVSLLEALSALKRDVSTSEQVRRFSPMYQYFLGPGILLLLAAWFLPERRAVA
ncbi:MAG: VWA domain-containing protein [Oscillospiraceae bacterium]|nr:VWA domain-containing protein [Oscillospiraceae bacterium]